MVTPFLPKLALDFGANLTTAGIMTGIFAFTALAARPLSGLIADRLNKKWLMAGATLAIAISVLSYAFAGSITLLFIIRIVHGLAFAVSSTTNMAFASTFIPYERMGEGISYLGLGYILALAIGPNISVFIANNYNYIWLFIFSSALAALAAFLMIFIKYNKPEIKSENEAAHIRIKDLIAVKLIPYTVLVSLFSLLNGLVSAFIILLGDERGIENIGIFFTLNAITLLAIRPFSGRLNDKKGLAYVLIPAYIFGAAAMLMLAGANAIWLIAAAGIFKALGQGMGPPGLQAECIRLMPEKRGVATSTYYIGADVGQGLGPVIGGAVSSAYGYGTMFSGAGILMLFGLIGFLILNKKSSTL